MNSTSSNDRLYGIQFLRFVAAFLVVALHLTEAVSLRIPAHHEMEMWRHGIVGVDVFFVISGFVMAISTKPVQAGESATRAAKVFFLKRLARIAPLYWFYSVCKILLVFLFPALALRTVLDPQHTLFSFLFIPSMDPSGHIFPVLPVGWTLNYEMFFYVVFALALLFKTPRLITCIVVFVAMILLKSIWPQNLQLSYLASPIIFEFLMGMGLAKLYQQRESLFSPSHAVVTIPIGCILMFATGIPQGYERLLYWGTGSVLLVHGFIAMGANGQLSGAFKKLRILGDISYSTYLSHTFVIPAVMVVLAKLSVSNFFLISATCVTFILISSLISYRLIEQPLIRVAKRFLLR